MIAADTNLVVRHLTHDDSRLEGASTIYTFDKTVGKFPNFALLK